MWIPQYINSLNILSALFFRLSVDFYHVGGMVPQSHPGSTIFKNLYVSFSNLPFMCVNKLRKKWKNWLPIYIYNHVNNSFIFIYVADFDAVTEWNWWRLIESCYEKEITMGSSSSKKSRDKSTCKKSEDPFPPPLGPEPSVPNGHAVTSRDVQEAISRGNYYCTLICCFGDISVTVKLWL